MAHRIVTLFLLTLHALLPELARGSLVEVEKLHTLHSETVRRKGWVSQGRAPPAAKISLLVAVKQRNVDTMNAVLWEVSDPNSPQYGNFLDNERVHDLLAPDPEHLKRVREWLQSSTGDAGAIKEATPNGDFLGIDVTVAQAETLLNATYHIYTHDVFEEHTVIRLALETSYRLPEDVAAVVDFVAPCHTFPLVTSLVATPTRTENPTITPSKLRALANMTDTDVGKLDEGGVKQGVASFLKQYYDADDLKAFRKKYDLSTDDLDTLLIAVPTSQKHSPVGVEASLDGTSFSFHLQCFKSFVRVMHTLVC